MIFFQITPRARARRRLAVDRLNRVNESGCAIAIRYSRQIAAVGVGRTCDTVAEKWSGSWPFKTPSETSGTTLPHRELHVSTQHLGIAKRTASRPPNAVERPTTIVYGMPYGQRGWAKYSTASFWKPYDDKGGGHSRPGLIRRTIGGPTLETPFDELMR